MASTPSIVVPYTIRGFEREFHKELREMFYPRSIELDLGAWRDFLLHQYESAMNDLKISFNDIYLSTSPPSASEVREKYDSLRRIYTTKIQEAKETLDGDGDETMSDAGGPTFGKLLQRQ